MELKVLALEPKILVSEPWILAIGAPNTGHQSQIFGPKMMPEDVETFLKKMKIEHENATFYKF